jgi:hypothetical protein
MSHPVSLSCSGERHEFSRQLHTLVQLLQRVPDTRDPSGNAAFFDTMRAVLTDVCAAAPEPWPGADALVMLAIAQLERQPLNNDPLVSGLLQLLQAVAAARSQRAEAVDPTRLKRPWTLRPGQVGSERRAAANEPDAHPDRHRPSARQDGAESAWLPAA